MKVTRTASVKLDVSPQESQNLLQTLEAYTKAYNFCCSTGFQNNTKNGIVLHQLTYQSTRDYLPSQDVPKSGKYLGIDRDIRKLAVTSDNKFYAGGQTRRVCQRYQNLRSKLQK
ncbi:MAG: hypothetical protein WC942_01275 [Clostridia bacterium]|jgi:predicted transposase